MSTIYDKPFWSVHVSPDNVLVSVRSSPDREFIFDSYMSPEDADAIGKMLIQGAKNARKLKQ